MRRMRRARRGRVPRSAALCPRDAERRQDTSNSAPPSPDSPIRQCPPVDRTIESAMASPSPAPPPCSVARWNRSNSRARSAAGIPGPLSSTVRLTRPPRAATLSRTLPSGPAYRQALSTSTPVSRSIHSGGALIQAAGEGLTVTEIPGDVACATAWNRSAHSSAMVHRSTGSAPGGGGCESNRASQSRSSTMLRSRWLSRSMRCRVARYLVRRAGCAQRDADFRADHRQRGAQFVRGVRGELQLAAPGVLHRGQRAQPDDQRPGEHGQQQHRRHRHLAVLQHVGHVLLLGQALAGHQPACPVAGADQPERAGAELHRGRPRPAGTRLAGSAGAPSVTGTGRCPGGARQTNTGASSTSLSESVTDRPSPSGWCPARRSARCPASSVARCSRSRLSTAATRRPAMARFSAMTQLT